MMFAAVIPTDSHSFGLLAVPSCGPQPLQRVNRRAGRRDCTGQRTEIQRESAQNVGISRL